MPFLLCLGSTRWKDRLIDQRQGRRINGAQTLARHHRHPRTVLGSWGRWASRSTAAAAEAPAATPVTRQDLGQTVLASGVIEASRLVSVGALVSGQVRALPVELGQRLKAGDLVAQIDPEDQQNDLLRAEAALAQTEAQIAAQEASNTEAQLALDRKRELASRGLPTPQDLEGAGQRGGVGLLP